MKKYHVNMLSVAVVAAVLLAGISDFADATQTSTVLRAQYGPRLLLRGGYGSERSGSGTDTSWASLPRRAYKWMAEGWRRIRNPRAGKEARAGESTFSGGSGKRRAPATDAGAGAISPESKRRRKEREGGASTARTEALPLRGGRSKGFGSTSKTLAKAGTVSESAPRADQADPGSKAKAEVAGMSAQELLREAEKIKSCGDGLYTIEKGYVPGMKATASFYASEALLKLVLGELKSNTGRGGFIPAVKQLANVATLPGVVSSSIGMPDIHSGYGFAIGNVAAMDMEDPEAVVSPGGVGFDINCGVRLLRSDLRIEDIENVKTQLADTLFKTIPVGVGEGSILGRLSVEELDEVLTTGMKWAEKKNLVWSSDRENVEEGGCFEGADASSVSSRAKQRGRSQCGSLGSGNHYAEVQVVDEVYDEKAASAMGLSKGSICVMLHSGSRGLGHQVCTDALQEMEKAMVEQEIELVDRQLACCRIQSDPGQRYLKAMKCAANFAFVNRSLMAMGVRRAFAKVFGKTAEDLGMHVVYDVSHNIAKEEEHVVKGKKHRVLVHRKGATRAFGPGHPHIPERYRDIGQPVLVGGSMGTCSYVLTGTEGAMQKTFGSTCHGAGRAMSRSEALRTLNSKQVLEDVEASGCTARVATRRLAAEEAPQSYKDVSEVVQTCHTAGISTMCVRLKPLICVKG